MTSHDIQKLTEVIQAQLELLEEKSIQQRSAHHSDLLRYMQQIENKVDENTHITKELKSHPIFRAWNDGKVIVKFIKWGGIALIGISTLLVAIKNGGSILKEYIKISLK